MSSTRRTSGRLAVAMAELLHQVVAIAVTVSGLAPLVQHGTDEARHELLARDDRDVPLGVLAVDLMTDSMKKVRFAKTDPAINEQGVVLGGGRVRHHARRCVRELVGLADHELVEGIAPVQSFRRWRRTWRGSFYAVYVGCFNCLQHLFLSCLLFHHFDIHGKGCLSTTFQVRKDGMKVVVFEPLLLVAVGRT
jgi:hypothetical protein